MSFGVVRCLAHMSFHSDAHFFSILVIALPIAPHSCVSSSSSRYRSRHCAFVLPRSVLYPSPRVLVVKKG